MKTLILLALTSLLAVALPGCGDDTGGSSGGGSGDGDGDGDGDTTSGGDGDGDGDVTDCPSLCGHYSTSTQDQKDCVADSVSNAHPAVLAAESCGAISSEATCNTCYDDASVPASACVAAYDKCF